MPRVCIVIVNHSRWRETVTCLQSVFGLSHDEYRVVICDNGSEDGSMQRITKWADGAVEGVDATAPVELGGLGVRIPYVSYTRAEAETGGDPELDIPLTLIDAGANLGYAGGCNVALRYLLAREWSEYAWLLNNDTVVHRDALSAMLGRLERDPDTLACGSTLLCYLDPERVQLLGGLKHSRWSGFSKRVGANRHVTSLPTTAEVEKDLAYINGASMLIDSRLLEDIGLLAENDFHYGEELDLALRASPRMTTAWARDSIVYHKGGATLGSGRKPTSDWSVAMPQLVQSRVWIARKYHPWTLPTVLLAQLLQAASFALQGRTGDARDVLAGLTGATK